MLQYDYLNFRDTAWLSINNCAELIIQEDFILF